MSVQIQNNTSLLYPKFYEKLSKGVEKARASGLDIHIFETFRSAERQEHLYVQKPQVTWTRGWMSWHQYGLAADLVFGGPGKWTWNGDYDKVRDFMLGEGLRGLGEKDRGHFEYQHPLSIFEAKQIALKNGQIAVWLAIENLLKAGKKGNETLN